MAIVLQPDPTTQPPSPSQYATAEQVRAAVTVPDTITEDEINTALGEAQKVVELYTGRLFGSHQVTVTARISDTGVAWLPDPMPIISDVRWPNAKEPIATDLWCYHAPTPVEDAQITVGLRNQYHFLVSGAGYYDGGYANLYRVHERIVVTGTAGTGSVPTMVRRATVMLAAWLLGLETGDTGSVIGVDDLAGVKMIIREGYRVQFETPHAASPFGVRIPTTGLPQADRLLASQVKRSAGLVVA